MNHTEKPVGMPAPTGLFADLDGLAGDANELRKMVDDLGSLLDRVRVDLPMPATDEPEDRPVMSPAQHLVYDIHRTIMATAALVNEIRVSVRL